MHGDKIEVYLGSRDQAGKKEKVGLQGIIHKVKVELALRSLCYITSYCIEQYFICL